MPLCARCGRGRWLLLLLLHVYLHQADRGHAAASAHFGNDGRVEAAAEALRTHSADGARKDV